ncbi:hypothetical protein [Terriglobus sp.]|uniref:hypothetical protein n=1 Tax=Terriglobus sp. TaxID=1889013 RepID=UPI003AFF9DAC
MNGAQIETLLDLIDRNVSLTRKEIAEYIVKHKGAIANSLAKDGVAQIQTRGGSLTITRSDLEHEPDSMTAAAA